MGELDGKSVIVTGAGRGLGRAYAAVMAEEGAHVVVNDEIERAARELEVIVHQQLSLESLAKQ